MSNNERTLEQIRNDIKIITTNKLSASQSKLLFMGITYEIILRRDLFPNNPDLKDFVNNVFIKYFVDKKPFKDYLYSCRTILGARIQKKIQLELEYNQIIRIVNELYKVLPNNDIPKSHRSRKVNNNSEVIQWMNFIKGK